MESESIKGFTGEVARLVEEIQLDGEERKNRKKELMEKVRQRMLGIQGDLEGLK